MKPIVHFEIPTDDLARAKKFYTDAFGWDMRSDKMPDGSEYTSAITTKLGDDGYRPKEPGSINGALIARDEKLKTPIITVSVDSIDDAIEKVKAAGGKVVLPKAVLKDVGEFAYVSDSEGNVIGLWYSPMDVPS